MTGTLIDIATHLGVAALAGGLIGFERSYHGRPAGFRTHTLVCMASSILMLVTIYQKMWFSEAAVETVRIDPTRMAQGVMTGIGFLGAGVIMKEGLSVRGLTTAASIWMTAAIGVLAGVGFYSAVWVGTIFTLTVVLLFRLIEEKITTLAYAHLRLRFHNEAVMTEEELVHLIVNQGFSIAHTSYRSDKPMEYFEYSMTIRTPDKDNMRRLAVVLSNMKSVLEFNILLTGD